jgi:hypothetical protein
MFTQDVKKIISGRPTRSENKITNELSGIIIDAKLKLEEPGSAGKTIDAIYDACRERKDGEVCPHINRLSSKERQTPWIKHPRKYESSTKGLSPSVFIVNGDDAYIGNLFLYGLINNSTKISIMSDGYPIYRTTAFIEGYEYMRCNLNFPRIFLPGSTSIEVVVENCRDLVLYADAYYVSDEEVARATTTPRDIEVLQNHIEEIEVSNGLNFHRLPVFYNTYLYRLIFGNVEHMDFHKAKFDIGSLSFDYDKIQAKLDSKTSRDNFYSMTFSDEPPFSKLCRDLNISGEDLALTIYSLRNSTGNKMTLCLQFLGKIRYQDGTYRILSN